MYVFLVPVFFHNCCQDISVFVCLTPDGTSLSMEISGETDDAVELCFCLAAAVPPCFNKAFTVEVVASIFNLFRSDSNKEFECPERFFVQILFPARRTTEGLLSCGLQAILRLFCQKHHKIDTP